MHCGCVERAENEPTHNEVPRHANAFSRCTLSKVLRCIAVSHYANSSGGVGQKNQATATFCQLVNTKSVNHNSRNLGGFLRLFFIFSATVVHLPHFYE